MANYAPCTISNPFRVKDRAAFAAWMDSLETGLEHSEVADTDDEVQFYGYEDLPTFDASGEEMDFFATLATHLAPESVVLIFSIGNEKLRYVCGFAYAIHPTGETVEVTLNDIYREAQEAFPDAEIQEAF